MPLYTSLQMRSAWSHEIYTVGSLYWYVCTKKESREKAVKRLHNKAPIFGFEEPQKDPLSFLLPETTVFLILRSDVPFAVRFNGKEPSKSTKKKLSEGVDESNVGSYMSFYGVSEDNINGQSVFGAYELLCEEGLFTLNAAQSKTYDLKTEQPSLEAILIKPTVHELSAYLPMMFSAASEEPYFETQKRFDGQWYPKLSDLLAEDAA